VEVAAPGSRRLGFCRPAEADGRKTPHGRCKPCRRQRGYNGRPVAGFAGRPPKKEKNSPFLFKNGSKYPVGLDIYLLICHNQKIKILLLGLH